MMIIIYFSRSQILKKDHASWAQVQTGNMTQVGGLVIAYVHPVAPNALCQLGYLHSIKNCSLIKPIK